MRKIAKFFTPLLIVIVFGGGFLLSQALNRTTVAEADNLRLDDQEATIRAIKSTMPAVVSIVVYDMVDSTSIDIVTGVTNTASQKQEKGSGTGFLISADGLILTNKHVVNVANEKTGEYRILLNNGKSYYAQLIGKDPLNDLAVLKIFDKDLPYVQLGDSDKLDVGSTVIAIGNALGKYQNSVTKGIVSGLSRSLVASDAYGYTESLDNIIQTDAQINPGNSGGPLIGLDGKVIGINVATDNSGSSLGFAIPINDARAVVRSMKEIGRIVRPRIGVRYQMINPEIAAANNLQVNYGAWILYGQDGTPAVPAGSPAEKVGIVNGDIILEINGVKLEGKNTLLSVVQKYKPGNKLGLKIQRGNKMIMKIIELDEFK